MKAEEYYIHSNMISGNYPNMPNVSYDIQTIRWS